jgi:pimeloyl-ACP methyl ester carboxylesterase
MTPSWIPAAQSGITIETVMAGGHPFEVAMAGSGDHLALCLHGFPELHYSWRHQIPLLAQLGYRVWAPNLRGYGASYRPPQIDDYRVAALLGDVAALVDASGASRLTLIAHDWGGALAWYFAIRKVRPLDRLVVMLRGVAWHRVQRGHHQRDQAGDPLHERCADDRFGDDRFGDDRFADDRHADV